MRRDGSKQPLCEKGIHHGDFIYKDQIRIQHDAFGQGAVRIGLDAQSLVNRRCRQPGGFLHPLRCLPGGGAAYDLRFRILFLIQIKDRPLNCGFACPRAAGYDAELGG